MKIPCRKYQFQLHPWPFMCTQILTANSEENVIFLPCFSTELAHCRHTGNKQKIAHRTVYFSTSVRPLMFRLWYDHCTSPPLPRNLHPYFFKYLQNSKTHVHLTTQNSIAGEDFPNPRNRPTLLLRGKSLEMNKGEMKTSSSRRTGWFKHLRV